MDVLKSVNKDLRAKVQDMINPEKFTGYLIEVMEKAKKEGTTEDMLNVVDKVVEIGYQEQTAINDTTMPPGLPSADNQQRLSGKKVEAPDLDTEEDLIGQGIDMDVMTDKEYEEAREEAGAHDSFLMDDDTDNLINTESADEAKD